MPENTQSVNLLSNLLCVLAGTTETTVDVESETEKTVITVKTSPKGRSILIGKNRSMLSALKTVFASLSGQDRHYYLLKISGERKPGEKSEG